MTTKEKEWIEKCRQNPERYKIYIDNDSVTIDDITEEECVFAFGNYGEYFIKDLFDYLNCNSDFA